MGNIISIINQFIELVTNILAKYGIDISSFLKPIDTKDEEEA